MLVSIDAITAPTSTASVTVHLPAAGPLRGTAAAGARMTATVSAPGGTGAVAQGATLQRSRLLSGII